MIVLNGGEFLNPYRICAVTSPMRRVAYCGALGKIIILTEILNDRTSLRYVFSSAMFFSLGTE